MLDVLSFSTTQFLCAIAVLLSIEVIPSLVLVAAALANKTITQKIKAVMCASFILILCTSCACAEESTDVAKDVIRGGIESAIIGMADSMLSSYDVTTANTSHDVNMTPEQRVVKALALYEQHPYKVQWIRDEVQYDYIIYFLSGILLLIFCAILYYAQIVWPEDAGRVTELVYGHEVFFGYTTFVKTLFMLVALPTVLPFVLNYSVDLEAAISSGIMQGSYEYITLSATSPALYIIQAVSYVLCASAVFMRVMVINYSCAKVLLIALMLCIPWDFILSLGKMTLLYFFTALAMRPIMLWITAMTVQYVAHLSPAEQIVGAGSMYALSIVLILLVCVIATMWPLVYIIIEILNSKIMRSARMIGRLGGI